mgnify:FL=1
MKTFDEYLATIPNEENRAKIQDILQWIGQEFPQLEARIAWSQPMFTHHGTFIIAFSVAKNHYNIALEAAGLHQFSQEIKAKGYSHGQMLMQVKWNQELDREFLRRMIQFNIDDKKDTKTFWRK